MPSSRAEVAVTPSSPPPGRKPALDVAPLVGAIAGAVGSHPVGQGRRLVGQDAPGVEQDQLGHAAGAGEGDGADAGLDQVGKEARRLDVGAAARCLGLVDEGRVPQDEIASAGGRAVIFHHHRLDAGQAAQVLAGVGDGRRAGDDLRRRAVAGAHSPQPPQHAAHVRAEDAAVDVGLVDHDEAQVGEKVGPQGVVGQDAQVQHVGVGEQDARLAAQRVRARLGGVAVVGAKACAFQLALGQLLQAAELILGQRLGGKEVQGAGAPVVEERFQDRDVVGQGLAAGRAGGQDHVLPGADGVDGLGLVGVQPLSADVAQGRFQSRRQRPVQLAIARLAGRQVLHVDHLVPVAGQLVDLLEEGSYIHRGSFYHRRDYRSSSLAHHTRSCSPSTSRAVKTTPRRGCVCLLFVGRCRLP